MVLLGTISNMSLQQLSVLLFCLLLLSFGILRSGKPVLRSDLRKRLSGVASLQGHLPLYKGCLAVQTPQESSFVAIAPLLMDSFDQLLQLFVPLLSAVASCVAPCALQLPCLLTGWLASVFVGSRLSLVLLLVAVAWAVHAHIGRWTARRPVLACALVAAAAAGADYTAFSLMHTTPIFNFSALDAWLQQWLHPAVSQWLLWGRLEGSAFKYEVSLDMHTYAAQLAFDQVKPWLFSILALHPLAYLPPAAVALAASPPHALLAGYTLTACLSAGTQLRDWSVVVTLLAVLFRRNAFRERRWGTALAACLHFASSVLFGFMQYLWTDRRTGNPNFVFFQADILIFTSFVMVTRVLVDYMHEATLLKWLEQYEESATDKAKPEKETAACITSD